jgi:alkyl sulfatase BDS1-like metallo-beta-lactamase superfamily hydrolase
MANSEWVQQFIDALHTLEQNDDQSPMMQLYADDCELWTLTHKEPLQGKAEIGKFWETYRKNFEFINSEFVRVIESEGRAALEWQAKGSLSNNGSGITYWGVTILDFNGSQITRFASYYDMKPFMDAIGIEPRMSAGSANPQHQSREMAAA